MSGRRKRRSESFFASLPELVDSILRRLPAKTLRVTCCVNRMWSEVSYQILQQRSKGVVRYYDQSLVTAEEVERLFNTLLVNPKVVILFSQRESWLLRRDPDAKRSEERQLARTLHVLDKFKPDDCLLLGCTTERVLIEEKDINDTRLAHKRHGHGILVLPRLEGVDYHHVYVRQSKPSRGQTWPELFELHPSTPVKLVIITTLSHSRDYIPHIAAGIRQTYGPRVVIIGSVAHDRIFIEGMIKRTRMTLLFISGNAFRACAKFINNDVDAQFYDRIESLSAESMQDEYEPVFNILVTSRFVTRGNAFYINAMTTFNRPVSQTPTVGMYSFGEFCLSSRDVGKTRPNPCKRFMRHNSAIFCACSYKRTQSLENNV